MSVGPRYAPRSPANTNPKKRDTGEKVEKNAKNKARLLTKLTEHSGRAQQPHPRPYGRQGTQAEHCRLQGSGPILRGPARRRPKQPCTARGIYTADVYAGTAHGTHAGHGYASRAHCALADMDAECGAQELALVPRLLRLREPVRVDTVASKGSSGCAIQRGFSGAFFLTPLCDGNILFFCSHVMVRGF